MMVKMILFKVQHTETVIENTVQEEAEVRLAMEISIIANFKGPQK